MNTPTQLQQTESSYVSGSNLILDLGPYGYDYFCRLEQTLSPYILQGVNNIQEIIQQVYVETMCDLVRAMGLHPHEALEMFKSFPHPSVIENLIYMVEYSTPFDALTKVIQEWVTFIYVNVLASQICKDGTVLYIPRKVGKDYLAVTEAHKTLVV